MHEMLMTEKEDEYDALADKHDIWS